tara:strand:- start:5945 stop:7138 length:1194 start_codon:yes stop_codon:yes gene_type:complete
MTISDMHTAVNQGVDKIHSLQADVLLNEEIDHELNKNIMRFINQRFNKLGNKYLQGFEQSQKRIDDLRTLLTEVDLDPFFKENLLGGNTYVDTVTLPEDDYLYLVKTGARVLIDKCKPISFDINNQSQFNYVAIPIQLLDADNAPLTVNQLFSRIVYYNSTVGSTPVYTTGTNIFTGLINETNASATIPANYNTETTSVQDLVQLLLDNPGFITNGFTIAIDAMDSVTKPGHLIIRIDTAVIPSFNSSSAVVVEFGILGTPDFYYQPKYSFQLSPELYKRQYNGKSSTKQIHACKYVQHDDIFKLLSDPFNSTKFTAPLYTISGSNLEIYSSDIFLIDKVKLLYIRKPAKVSLSSQVSCDLPDHTHQEVIDMTVSTILGNIGDPRYQIAAAEKLQSE